MTIKMKNNNGNLVAIPNCTKEDQERIQRFHNNGWILTKEVWGEIPVSVYTKRFAYGMKSDQSRFPT